MNESQLLTWIKTNLSPMIQQALANAKAKAPNLLYTEDWLAAIAMRETGELIDKRIQQAGSVPAGRQLSVISPLIRGDYNQRPGEKLKSYHGFGFWQIDIASFPAFVKSGDWKNPLLTCEKAISVLEDKRAYLQNHDPDLTGENLARATTAAYNCGEGNIVHVLAEGHDIDIRTTGKNYSAEVWRFRKIYQTL